MGMAGLERTLCASRVQLGGAAEDVGVYWLDVLKAVSDPFLLSTSPVAEIQGRRKRRRDSKAMLQFSVETEGRGTRKS